MRKNLEQIYAEHQVKGLNALVNDVLILDYDLYEQKIDDLNSELSQLKQKLLENELLLNEKDKIIFELINQLRLQNVSDQDIISRIGLSFIKSYL